MKGGLLTKEILNKIFKSNGKEYSLEEYIKNSKDWTLQTYNEKNQLINVEDYYGQRKTLFTLIASSLL